MDAYTRYTFDSDGRLIPSLEELRKAYANYDAVIVELNEFNKANENNWENYEAFTTDDKKDANKVMGKRAEIGHRLQKATSALIKAAQEVSNAWIEANKSLPF